jgi:hypothetical protein
MKKLLCILAITVLFCSCSSDDSGSGEVLLMKTVVPSFWNEPRVVSNYSYNGTKLVKITRDNGKKSLYTYVGKLIVQIKNSDQGNFVSEELFEYDSQDRLVSHKFNDYEIDNCERKTFTYNLDNSVSIVYSSGTIAVQDNISQTATYFIENGEVDHSVRTFTSDTEYYATYTYDDKNKAVKNILGFDKIYLAYGEMSRSHNLVQVVFTYSNSDQVDSLGYVYTYNDEDYPTVTSFGDGTIFVDGSPTEMYYN